jgi:hypothetical protein
MPHTETPIPSAGYASPCGSPERTCRHNRIRPGHDPRMPRRNEAPIPRFRAVVLLNYAATVEAASATSC